MLRELGLLPAGAVMPLLLIGAGGGLLAVARTRGDPADDAPQTAGVVLDGAREARLRLHYGAGTLVVGPGAAPGSLYDGSFTGGVRQEVAREGDRLTVTLRHDTDPDRYLRLRRALDWYLALGADVTVDLDISTGASRLHLNLTDLRVRSLRLRTGASDVDLTLPAHGHTTIRIEAGAADIRIHVPPGLAASVSNRSAFAGVHIDRGRFPRVGDLHRSPGYDAARDRAEIELEGAAASFSVR
jgi:hypothetical protein